MSSLLCLCQILQLFYKRADVSILVNISVKYWCFVDENKTLFSITRPCC